MKEGSMIETAIAILEENGEGMHFKTLWAKVKEKLDISPEEEETHISPFYTDLTLSGVVTHLGDGQWDLCSRHKYDDIKKDTGYTDEDLEASEELVEGEEGEAQLIEGEPGEDEENPNGLTEEEKKLAEYYIN